MKLSLSPFSDHMMKAGESIAKQWVPLNPPPQGLIPIKISAVKTPSDFWIQFNGPLYSEKLKDLTNKMNFSYACCSKYADLKFDVCDLEINMYAAINYKGRIHRVRIESIFLYEGISVAKVFHVDYGCTTTIPAKRCMYLFKCYAVLPQQAFSATCANIIPNNYTKWTIPSINRFIELVANKSIVAHIINSSMYTLQLQLILVDVTNVFAEINVNDALLDGGYGILAQSYI